MAHTSIKAKSGLASKAEAAATESALSDPGRGSGETAASRPAFLITNTSLCAINTLLLQSSLDYLIRSVALWLQIQVGADFSHLPTIFGYPGLVFLRPLRESVRSSRSI